MHRNKDSFRFSKTGAHYQVSLRLDGAPCPVWMRPPNPARVYELLRLTQGGTDDVGRFMRILGIAIGYSWADPGVLLETPRPRAFSEADLLAYGDDILDELHTGGSTPELISAAGLECLQRAGASVHGPPAPEVADRADFSDPPTAG